MSINIPNKLDKGDKPLTRADVERILHEVGSSDKLNLSGQNLEEIDLTGFHLAKATLIGANLSKANLSKVSLNEANLLGANLSGTNLHGANLSKADLSRAALSSADLSNADLIETDFSLANLSWTYMSKANLSDAILIGANLSGAVLVGATLIRANLSRAYLLRVDLSEANLARADLRDAYLIGTDLIGANLRGANLIDAELISADLRGANLSRASVSEGMSEQLLSSGAIGLDELHVAIAESGSVLRIRITEEPLTAQNLTTIISSLTELSTKYWLIAKGSFAELIEYTQTHNGRFAEEAQVVVTRITYNSPMNMDWKVDLSAPSVAEALVTTIDGITQVRKRLEQAELAIQAKAQKIKHAEQQAEHEQQMAMLEREKQQLEIEQHRLEILEKQLEVQKKGIEYALEIASKVVDTLHPGADAATRAMEIQVLLPNLIQLQSGKGLELALPAPQKSEGKGASLENE